MNLYDLNKTKIYQMHLAIKDIYTLVISVNYTKNTYSIIDSKLPKFLVCDNQEDFRSFVFTYFKKVHPDDMQNYPLICDFDSLVEHLQNNRGRYNFEARLESPDSIFTWYEGSYFLVDNPDNDDVLLLLLFKDINNQKLIEENLKDAFIATEHASKTKTDFLSRMSQDLRTPISLIVNMIDSARNNIDDKEKVMDCLVKMDISSRYLFQLIDNILDTAKLEAGRFSIDNNKFSMSATLEEIEADYKEQALAKHIDFNIQKHINGLTNLIGDDVRLKQVLKNLISNSFKYTPVGGSISVELFLNKVVYNRAFFSFVVKNSGPLLDESQIERFFQPFEKGSISAQTKCFEGLGLGLSICKNTVELLGGTITASNLEDESGVLFDVEVSFELDEDNVPDDIEFLDDSAYIRFPQKNVLIAEDDQQNYETIKALLENRGVTVDLAIDGLEAVNAFEQAPSDYYDLILINVDLPVMSGLDTTNAIRNSFHGNGATVPIVGMSLDVLNKNLILALNAGMDAHISKPIDMNKLFSTLKNYI